MTRRAPINKIIPLSTVDGAGARTAIFFQGCNISCAYCHNPETQRLCTGCGICVENCPVQALTFVEGEVNWNVKQCVACDMCIKSCPFNSSPKVRQMSAEEIIDEITSYLPFIRGITVSGGECMLYSEFLLELFTLAASLGLNCLIDSNGTIDFSKHTKLIGLCEGVMLDVKAWDEKVYADLTGDSNNDVVKRNISFLAACGRLEEIRIVYVNENLVDAKTIISKTSELLGSFVSIIRLKLITFRNYGVTGKLKSTPSPDEEQMKILYEEAYKKGYRQLLVL